MSQSEQTSSVLIISSDASVVEAIVSNNKTDQVFNARPSVQEALSEPDLLSNNSIVIFDIATTGDDIDKAIDQAIKIKQADPTQVLMIVGEKEPLNDILKSNIQPIVYRAFNKPISPNQLFLSFTSANALHLELIAKQAAGEDILIIGPQENKTSVDTIAEERKTNPAIFAGIGALVLAIIAYLFLGGNTDNQPVNEVIDIAQDSTEEIVSNEVNNVNSQLNDLNQKAANALLDGRLVSPSGDNALEYYDLALAVDPYDSIAYEGRKAVAAELRKSYASLIKKEKFDEAFKALDKVRSIEPLNPENDKLQRGLEAAVKKAAEKERLANTKDTANSVASIKKKLDASKSNTSNAKQAEQTLINQINSAISSNNLIPPSSNNAYSLISTSLRSNKISRANSTPLLKSLSSKLLSQANASFNRGDIATTDKLMGYINRVDVGNPGLSTLRSKVNSRKIAIAQNKSESEAAAAIAARNKAEQTRIKEAKIIPAKVISRSAPRYPASAEKRNIEGWVEVTFVVDTEGTPKDIAIKNANPKGYFEEAAMKSVRKWHFSPARNQTTGQAVESKPISTKLNFELE